MNGDTRVWEVLISLVYPDVWAVAAAELDDVAAGDVCEVIFLRLAQRLHESTDVTQAIDWACYDATDGSRRACVKEAARKISPASADIHGAKIVQSNHVFSI